MPKFRRRPLTIEAVQWFKQGDHPAVQPFLSVHPVHGTCLTCGRQSGEHGTIRTPKGDTRVCPGDWIITGVAEEVYPCKPDVFEETYEPITEKPQPSQKSYEDGVADGFKQCQDQVLKTYIQIKKACEQIIELVSWEIDSADGVNDAVMDAYVEQCIDQIERDIAACPLEDGIYHPAQTDLELALMADRQKVLGWIDSLLSKAWTLTPLIRLLGRMRFKHCGKEGLDIIKKALRFEYSEVRDAAIQALENWGTDECMEILTEHYNREHVPWLRDYIEQALEKGHVSKEPKKETISTREICARPIPEEKVKLARELVKTLRIGKEREKGAPNDGGE